MGALSDYLGARTYIDANIVIYAIEGFVAHERPIRALLTAMDTGEITTVTSELTLAEVLVKPMRDQSQRLIGAYQTFLEPTPALAIIPIDRRILEHAAAIRAANTAIKLPDAIHLATALRERCTAFLTIDGRLQRASSPRIVLLDDIADIPLDA